MPSAIAVSAWFPAQQLFNPANDDTKQDAHDDASDTGNGARQIDVVANAVRIAPTHRAKRAQGFGDMRDDDRAEAQSANE